MKDGTRSATRREGAYRACRWYEFDALGVDIKVEFEFDIVAGDETVDLAAAVEVLDARVVRADVWEPTSPWPSCDQQDVLDYLVERIRDDAEAQDDLIAEALMIEGDRS